MKHLYLDVDLSPVYRFDDPEFIVVDITNDFLSMIFDSWRNFPNVYTTGKAAMVTRSIRRKRKFNFIICYPV